jgi:hypothetical protein
MRVKGIIADLQVADIESAKGFSTDYLGLSTEGFTMGWVARYSSPETGTRVQLLTRAAKTTLMSCLLFHLSRIGATQWSRGRRSHVWWDFGSECF